MGQVRLIQPRLTLKSDACWKLEGKKRLSYVQFLLFKTKFTCVLQIFFIVYRKCISIAFNIYVFDYPKLFLPKCLRSTY